MKGKTIVKSYFSVLLAVIMVITVMAPMSALAAIEFDTSKLGEDIYFTSRTDYVLAPGITETHITTNNAEGTNQIASYAVEVDLSNPTTSIIAGYKDYNGNKIGFQKVRDQAYAAEEKRNLNVVAGTNADFFNMQTGEPYGALVMQGTVYHKESKLPWFGITEDGKAVISEGKLTSDIVEAVGGKILLVKDGEVTEEALEHDLGKALAPRTAVGITAEGKVILYVADGRQAPYSSGQYFYELAHTLAALGCETALCLDGGGSTTYVSQHEGEQELVCRNRPSDGVERTVSSALLVCSSAKPSGVFHHATLTPNNIIYTPGSTVQFAARGVDSSGYAAELPADGKFVLADDSFGTITADGKFTSNGKTGEVVVNYVSEAVVCGTVSIEVQIPDELYVANTEQAVGPEETTDFGIVAKYMDRDVTMKDDDIEWTIAPQTVTEPEADVCHVLVGIENLDTYKDKAVFGKYPKTSSYKANYYVKTPEVVYTDNNYAIIKYLARSPSYDNCDIDSIIANKIANDANILAYGYTRDYLFYDAGLVGSFSGLTFTGAADGSYNAFITAKLKCNEEIAPVVLTIFIGSMQTTLYDFEYVTGEENKDAENYIPGMSLPINGANWLTANGYSGYRGRAEELGAEGWPLFMWPNASVENDTVVADVVNKEDGEPVRFGDNSLRISFDYASYDFSKNSNFYLRTTSPAYAFEGSPTAIGIWVYAPEGTAPYLLYLNCASEMTADNIEKGIGHTVQSYQCITNEQDENGKSGINWNGWKYLEFKLTDGTVAGSSNVADGFQPYGENPGSGVFWISYQPKVMDHVTADTIYIDDITLIYGANTSDTINPKVTYLGDVNNGIVDGETVYTTNTVSFKASYADAEDKYMTGINDAATKMYIDGVDVTDKCYINEGDDEIYFYDAVLADGVHNIEIEVVDNFGNVTTEMRYFTIDSNSDDTELMFLPANAPILGKDYVFTVASNNASDITSADIVIKVLSDFTSYWRDMSVVPSANYELEGEPEYNSIKDTFSFKVVRKADADTSLDDGILAEIITSVPSNTPENLNVTHRIAKGALTYASEKTANYVNGFSAKISDNCASAFIISTDVMIKGSEGGNIYIKDTEDAPAAGVEVYTTDDVLLGTTDDEGKLYTDAFVTDVATFSVYAVRGEERSFIYKSQTYAAGGDETGLPTNILLNASEDPATQQNISWMASPIAAADKAVVKYAEKSAFEADGDAAFTEFEGISYLDVAAASGNIETNYAIRFNTAVITGLNNGAEYVYVVGDGTNWSDVRTFTTDVNGKNTNFFIFGDTQDADTSNVDAITAQLEQSGIKFDFGLQTGDAVDNAGSYAYWNGIGNVFSNGLLGETDIIHVLGNHEYTGDANAINAAHYFNLPGTTDEAPLAYSFEYGNVYVAALTYLSASTVEEAAQWLIDDAAKSNANWKILTLHQPIYFTNAGGGTSREMMDKLAAAVDEIGIDFVFSGHDHSYARTYPLKNGVRDENGTVHFICAATSADKSYAITSYPQYHEIATDEYDSVYLTVSTTDTKLDITVWNYDGYEHLVMDTYSATRTVNCTETGAHNYAYDGKYLSCTKCGYSISAEGYTGWAEDSETGKKMYFIAGQYRTGWFTLGTDHYIFDDKGLIKTGEVSIDGHKYLFDANGQLIKGSLEKNDDGTNSYYINGELQRGWFEIDGKWYYFSKTKGYKTHSGRVTINKMEFVFSKEGYVEDGCWNETEMGTSYYDGPNPVTGLIEIDGYTYYFSPEDTYMLVNESVEIDGDIYSFGSNGRLRHYGEHNDANGDGKCDDCETKEGGINGFIERIRDFFLRIVKFFRNLFVL